MSDKEVIGVFEGTVGIHYSSGPHDCICGRCQRTGGPHAHGLGWDGLSPTSLLADALWERGDEMNGRRLRVTVEVLPAAAIGPTSDGGMPAQEVK